MKTIVQIPIQVIEKIKDGGNMILTPGKVLIRNMPKEHQKYVVCRLVDGDLWFYTSWKTKEKAEDARREFENGVVVEVKE